MSASLAMLALAAPARAEAPLLLMLGGEAPGAMEQAVAVELASRSVAIMVVDPPDGETALARAAAAQYACRFAGAAAAVYVEGDEVRVVGPDGDAIRRAPLPAPLGSVDPRVFAVVARSLVDELFGPPEMPIRVTVAIDAPGREVELARVVPGHGEATAEVELGGTLQGDGEPPAEVELAAPPPALAMTPVAPPPPPAEAAAPVPVVTRGAALVDGEVDGDAPILPRSGLFIETSALFAGLAAGGGMGIGWQMSEALRLGASLSIVGVFDEGFAYMPSISLTRVGDARSWRFDFGAMGGLVIVEDEYTEGSTAADVTPATYTVNRVGWTLGGFFGWAFEVDDWIGVGARLSLQVAGVDGGSGPIVVPMLSVFSELPI